MADSGSSSGGGGVSISSLWSNPRLRAAAVVLVLVIGMASLSQGACRTRAPDSRVSAVVRSAAEWATIAKQDSNPMVSLLHANYAMAYLHVARSLASDDTLERVANVRLDEFTRALQDTQSSAIQSLTGMCPAVAPAGLTAINTGWLIN